ncbi:MAG: hypothetical protein CMD26_01695 [Flavobacteriales bacterium]|nr:hypothetical protein [Flavobacteriales bacterium]
MNSVINILSPDVVNQIAAGEVIQRPASVVKELLENSIDANSENIEINIENSGKTLIQIIDDGKGMSEQDAEICFQKHTTSKIKKTADILKITTMGFRGEALSSIASIADVELCTKTNQDKIGTLININNSKIRNTQKIAIKNGTSISVKNLFFNVPARKNFLKSDTIEMKHILESFMQVAISNHNVSFKLKSNNKIIYNLNSANLKQRIIQLFGKRYNEKVLTIKEETSIVSVTGFLGNPIDAKRSRGEQFLFINNRFVRSPYLNHAIKSAMDSIITKEQHPAYFIFLSIEPNLIDINIHPSKIEVKFEDENSIYQILKSACKRSIGMHNIIPSLDFEVEESFEIPTYTKNTPPREPKLKINTSFNPFKKQKEKDRLNTEHFDELFSEEVSDKIENAMNIDGNYATFVIVNKQQKSFNIVDKKKAIQRIQYEKIKKKLSNNKITAQTLIQPLEIKINQLHIKTIEENREIIELLGYSIKEINNNFITIQSIPAGLDNNNTQAIIELFIKELQANNKSIKEKIIHETALKISKNTNLKDLTLNISSHESLTLMLTKLLKCDAPFIAIDGAPCVINIEPNQLFTNL